MPNYAAVPTAQLAATLARWEGYTLDPNYRWHRDDVRRNTESVIAQFRRILAVRERATTTDREGAT